MLVAIAAAAARPPDRLASTMAVSVGEASDSINRTVVDGAEKWWFGVMNVGEFVE